MPSEADFDSTADRDNSAAAIPKANPVCPACGGHLIEIRAKLQCQRCHRICETCCEGTCG